MSAVRCVGVSRIFKQGDIEVTGLDNVSVEIEPAEFVCLVAPSGGGKTTLLNAIGGLDRPDAGEIWVAGKRIDNLSKGDLAEMRLNNTGFVFQAYNLLPQLDVLENIEVPLTYNGGMTADDRKRTNDLANLVGLDERAEHRPTELSGGQQQRAGIARSLINQPEFILADEATGNLDTGTTEEILDLFDDLNEKGTTIVMVTHEEEVAERARRMKRVTGVLEITVRRTQPEATGSARGPRRNRRWMRRPTSPQAFARGCQ